jgi:transcription initiation factor TFIID TATA-box-binding protein
MPNFSKHHQRFAAVIMRLTKPKSTALVFESGKMVVLGAKTTNDVSFDKLVFSL